MGGGTNTHKPLQYVKRSMFTAQNGDRPEKKNVCVVITDGKSYQPDETGAAAQKLREDGVEMFALGVGGGVDTSELLAIAGDTNRVFEAISYDELDVIIEAFATSVLGTCENDDPPSAPVITGTPENAVDVGTNIELRCSSETQSTDASLTWFRNNYQIPGTNYKIEGDSVVSYLRFNAETNDGEAVYECLLTHPLLEGGLKTQTTFDVMLVPGVPQITYNPSSSVLDSTKVSLTCRSETQDVANTEVVWIKSSKTIEGVITKGSDVISNVIIFPASLIDNRERYECHVLHPNFPEPLVDYADLTVMVLPGNPMISADPAGPVRAGSRVTLTCVSAGTDENTELVWLRQGSVVDDSYYISGRVVRNDLTVTATSSRDYVCRVRHPALTEDLTAQHSLNTYTPPQPPRIAAINPVRSMEERVNLVCTVQPADALTELVWVENDRVIDSSFVRTGSTMTNEYSIRAADVEGIHCEARHVLLDEPLRADPPRIVIRRIVLPGSPVINNNEQIRSYYVGEEAELVCRSASTDINTNVVWYRSDSPNPIDSTHAIEGAYVVNRLSVQVRDDDLTYECRVTHPDLTQSLRTTVQIPVRALPSGPEITIRPKSALIAGSVFTTSCQSLTSDPEVQLYWYVNGRRVGGAYRQEGEYIVNDLRYDVEGGEVLECRAEISRINYQKSDYVTLNTIDLSTPRVSQEPQRAQHRGSVKLFCSAEHSGELNHRLEWYRRGQLVDDSSYTTNERIVNELDIPELNPDLLEYTCTLRYQNKKTSTVYTIVTELPLPVIVGTPTLPVARGSYIPLTCYWPSYEPAFVQWYDMQTGRMIDSSSQIVNNTMLANEINVLAEQSVRYECRVTNRGTDPVFNLSTRTAILVQDATTTAAPDLDVVEIEQDMIPGTDQNSQAVKLTCKTRHLNLQGITLDWYQSGEIIDSSYYISDEYIVNQLEVKMIPDVNTLTCRSTFGTKTSESTITLKRVDIGNPVVRQTPTPAKVGERVRIVCEVPHNNIDNLRLSWVDAGGIRDDSSYRNGPLLVNELDLTVNPEILDYTCILNYGTRTRTIPHRISYAIEAPEIEQLPPAARPGESIVLICKVRNANVPGQRLVWYRDGLPIASEFSTTENYVLSEVYINDRFNSDYKCEHEMNNKKVTAPHIPIVVQMAVPVISNVPRDPIESGSDVNLRCDWRGSAPQSRLVWLNAETGEILDDSFSTTSDVMTNDIPVKANGKMIYECRVTGLPEPPLARAQIPVVPIVDPRPECAGAAADIDVVIILDSSTTIQRPDFARQLEFVKRFVAAFTIGPDHVQVGIVSFSDNKKINFQMNEYNDKKNLSDAIGAIRQIGGNTNTHLPIQAAREVMFTRENGDRPTVKNLCIVLTDGDSNQPELTAEQSRLARESGIDMYAIGVGSSIGFDELRAIAGDRDRYFYAEDYRALQNIENEFVSATKRASGNCDQVWSEWGECSSTCGYGVRIRSRGNETESLDCNQQPCEEWTTWSECSKTCGPGQKYRSRGSENEVVSCIDRICEDDIMPRWPSCMTIIDQADIAFLLDTSNSVYEPDFETMKLFLTDFIGLFNISSDKQRIASLTYSDDVEVNFHLNDFYSNSEVQGAILGIKMHLGGTNTHKALEYMRTDLFDENNGARTNSPKIAFVITDGRSHNPAATAAQAIMARRFGVILYSIGIGPATDDAELEQIAGNITRVYKVDSYDDIRVLKQRIGIDLSVCYDPNEPVDGVYGTWSPWSACSVACGFGQRSRTRSCNSPTPRNGGKDCSGDSRRIKTCRADYCQKQPSTPSTPPMVDGWSEWEFSTPCSTTCGQGIQELVRVCLYDTTCEKNEVEKKIVECQIRICNVDTSDRCGGTGGLNVMFAAQNINSKGPNSYHTVELIKNISSQLPIDGSSVRTSLTLSECTCPRNTGYDLYSYRNFNDVMNHLNKLDLHDTYSLLNKVREEHGLKPDSRDRVNSAKQTLVLFIDRNDYITPKTIEEINKIQLAGVEVFVIAMDPSENRTDVRSLASTERYYNYWSDSLREIYRELCD